MKVQCFTNIDKYRDHHWPREMVCRPEIGDKVASQEGMRLQVVSLTHCGASERSFEYLLVELHMPLGMPIPD
jgi:hypothetical protein